MAEKDKASPATTSYAHDFMSPRWAVIETLLGGTEAMRQAGETYLPKHQEETDEGYTNRLNAAVLTNFVEQTLDTLAGKPFTEPVTVNEDVPKAIQDQVLNDVDLQGNKLDVFCRQWFREGMGKAFCHVLVDMPKPAAKADGKPRTLADDRKEGVRPYWVMIKPECVLFARAEVINGVETLQHIRIVETYTIMDGFAEVCKQRIRVLEPGVVELYEKDEARSKPGKEVWNMTETWGTGLEYIPLVTFYADREAFMVGKPPLLDLAWLNIAHWQSTADQRHILTVSRFPILACSGAAAEDSDPIVVGPNKVLYNPDAQGKFYYVEHTGAAIEAGRNDLKDLEEACSAYGAEFLREKPGDQTATGRALDSAEASTDLSSIAGIFEDAVAQALSFTAEWMRLGDKGGTIGVVKEYDLAEQEAAGMTAIQSARDKRDISRFTYLEALKLRGYLPEDFDAELDAERLLEEQDAALARAGFDLDPLGNPKKPAQLDENGNPKEPGAAPQPPGTPPAKKTVKKAAKKVTK
jgi:hypothetical protein